MCIDSQGGGAGDEKFAACETEMKNGQLSGCKVGCAPTLSMLQRSESPVVTLSEGKFGTETDLARATGTAPKPACTFGAVSDVGHQCRPPSSYEVKQNNPKSCNDLGDIATMRGDGASAPNQPTEDSTNVDNIQTTSTLDNSQVTTSEVAFVDCGFHQSVALTVILITTLFHA